MDTSQDSSLRDTSMSWNSHLPNLTLLILNFQLWTPVSIFIFILLLMVQAGTSSTLSELMSIMITEVIHNIHYYQEKTLTRKEENITLSYVQPLFKKTNPKNQKHNPKNQQNFTLTSVHLTRFNFTNMTFNNHKWQRTYCL